MNTYPKIREARLSDAAALNRHIRATFVEAGHLITKPGECRVTGWRQRYRIAQKQIRSRETCLVATVADEIVGMLDSWTDQRRRVRHSTCFAMSVREEWRRKGVGKKLLLHFIKWVHKHETLERIELHVHSDNEAAIALYEHMGFRCEGIRRAVVRYEDGRVVDDHLMALWPGENQKLWPEEEPL